MAPAGLFKVKELPPEDTQGFDEVERLEEPRQEPPIFHCSLENWVHLAPEINCFGRVTPEEIEYTDPELDDEGKERIREQIRKIDRPKERLLSIAKDKGELIS